jgi:hypothetical protein
VSAPGAWRTVLRLALALLYKLLLAAPGPRSNLPGITAGKNND